MGLAPEVLDTIEKTIIPDSHRDLLAATQLAHLATIGPRGEPQSNPVWFDWNGTHLLIGLTPARQKYRNVKEDPRIAVSIIDPVNPQRYLEIRGRVVKIDPDHEGERMRHVIRKYTGADELPSITGKPEILVIEPVHTSSMG